MSYEFILAKIYAHILGVPKSAHKEKKGDRDDSLNNLKLIFLSKDMSRHLYNINEQFLFLRTIKN